MCDRRITNGEIDSGRKYMVYLLNSMYSENQPEAWLCGGVLISQAHVLTSAACLTEVSHMYVIAGYNKYVSSKNIEKDNCTRTKKRKIVKIFVPKAFNGSTWMQYDVGLGVVDKNYYFLDISFRKVCSYEPGSILVNFRLGREATKSPVLALGWGAAYAREPGMTGDTNSIYLRRTYSMITNTTYCRAQFPKDIHYMFLCTHNNSVVTNKEAVTRFIKREENITSSTRLTTRTTVGRYFKEMWRCHGKHFSSNDTPAECLDLDSAEQSLWRRLWPFNVSATSNDTFDDKLHKTNDTFDDKLHKTNDTFDDKLNKTNDTFDDKLHKTNDTFDYKLHKTNDTFDLEKWDVNQTIFRKQGKPEVFLLHYAKVAKEDKNSEKVEEDAAGKGKNFGKEGKNFGDICQNDHGGPLISLDGPAEMVIGIALNSVYNKKYQCKGPSLYLSTAQAGSLIHCLRSKTLSSLNPKLCTNNYAVKEYNVIWPTTPIAQEVTPEVSKQCKNGQCETTEEPERLENTESEEQILVQPIAIRPKPQFFSMGDYKRPNVNLNFLVLKPSFNMGMFPTRPTF